MVALLLFLASANPVRSADAAATELSKGATLYHVCQAEVKLMDLPSLAAATEADIMDGSYCMGYLNGFMGSLPRADASICMQTINMGTLARVYVDFMDKNSRLLSADRTVGLRLALRNAFPCPGDMEPRSATAPSFSRKVL